MVSLEDISSWVPCGMSRPHPPSEGDRESVHEVASLPYPLVGSALAGAYKTYILWLTMVGFMVGLLQSFLLC